MYEIARRMRKKFPVLCRDLDDSVSYITIDILGAVDRYTDGKAKDGMKGWLIFVGTRKLLTKVVKDKKQISRNFSLVDGLDTVDRSQDPTCYEPLADEIIAEMERGVKTMKWNVLARKRLRLQNAYRA